MNAPPYDRAHRRRRLPTERLEAPLVLDGTVSVRDPQNSMTTWAKHPHRSVIDDHEGGVITQQEVNSRLWEQLSSLDEDGNQAIDPDQFDSRLGRHAGRFAGLIHPIRRGYYV